MRNYENFIAESSKMEIDIFSIKVMDFILGAINETVSDDKLNYKITNTLIDYRNYSLIRGKTTPYTKNFDFKENENSFLIEGLNRGIDPDQKMDIEILIIFQFFKKSNLAIEDGDAFFRIHKSDLKEFYKYLKSFKSVRKEITNEHFYKIDLVKDNLIEIVDITGFHNHELNIGLYANFNITIKSIISHIIIEFSYVKNKKSESEMRQLLNFMISFDYITQVHIKSAIFDTKNLNKFLKDVNNDTFDVWQDSERFGL